MSPLYPYRVFKQRGQFTFARFEVLTVVLLKYRIFWDVMLCRWVSVARRFGES
jgi:hypothetical protein